MKTNNQAPRTIDAIYFTVNLKKQGGYAVLDLKSGLPITITYSRYNCQE